MTTIFPSRSLLASYARMRRETLPTCKEGYILPEDPFAPPPSGFVPSLWRWAILDYEVVGVLNVRPRLNAALAEWGGNIGVAVSASHRGLGIGSMLFKEGVRMMRAARKSDLTTALVTIEKDNTPSLRMTFSAIVRFGWCASVCFAEVGKRQIVRIGIKL